jgi:hypothetical protein
MDKNTSKLFISKPTFNQCYDAADDRTDQNTEGKHRQANEKYPPQKQKCILWNVAWFA